MTKIAVVQNQCCLVQCHVMQINVRKPESNHVLHHKEFSRWQEPHNGIFVHDKSNPMELGFDQQPGRVNLEISRRQRNRHRAKRLE